MVDNYLYVSLAIAGVAVLWRNFLHDTKWANATVKHSPRVISHVLTCGLCFTFWTTFFVLLVLRIQAPLFPHTTLLEFFIDWMSLGFLATTLRYLFVLIQESSQTFFKKNHTSHTH